MDWIKCITSRLLHAARHEAGITLIETLFAIAIFGIVSTSVIGVISSATAADGLSRQRSIALELAQQQIEYIRQLNYADVCVVSGNPACPATVPPQPPVVGVTPTLQKRVMGLWYQLTTSISWVNDTVTTGVATGANYKRIRVTVSRMSDNKQLALVYTFVANPSSKNVGGINNAIINVSVLDYGCTIGDGCTTNASPAYLQGAQVNLWDGPSLPASDVTDETGAVTFAGLTPNPAGTNGVLLPTGATAYYDILASLSGYTTLRESKPPGTVPSGTGAGPVNAAHLQINPGQTQTANISLYRPATIYVQVQDADGNPYTGDAIVDIGALHPRCAQEFFVSGSPTGTNLAVGPLAPTYQTIGSTETVLCPGGEPPVSGASYTVGAHSSDGTLAAAAVQKPIPNTYPTDLTSVFVVKLRPVTPKSCTVTVKKASVNISGARVDVVDGTLGAQPQIYATGVTNSSGVAVFNGQTSISLPDATIDYDIKVSSTSGNGGLTDQVVPNNQPTAGLCNFAVTLT